MQAANMEGRQDLGFCKEKTMFKGHRQKPFYTKTLLYSHLQNSFRLFTVLYAIIKCVINLYVVYKRMTLFSTFAVYFEKSNSHILFCSLPAFNN